MRLISAVNVTNGITNAIKSFDHAKGYRFSTFVQDQIVWAIKAHLKKERRLPKTVSLHSPLSRDGGDQFIDQLPDDTEHQYSVENEELLAAASVVLNKKLSALSERERLIC